MRCLVKHAFAVFFHKNFEQLNILLTQLDDSDFDIYLHIDAKVDFSFNQIREMQHARIFFIEKRVDIKWAGFSMILAQRYTYEQIYQSDIYYDFIHMISAQDLFIKPIAEFKDFLADHGQKQYVAYWISPASIYYHNGENFDQLPEGSTTTKTTPRLVKVWAYAIVGYIPGHQIAFKKKKEIDIKLKKGAAWMSFTYECLAYIVTFLNENEDFFNSFQDVMCPDEILFPTIVWNSPFRHQIFNTKPSALSSTNNLRSTRWVMKGNDIFDMPNTMLYTEIHRKFLIHSNAFIARKFDIEKDRDMVDYVRKFLFTGKIRAKSPKPLIAYNRYETKE